MIKKVGKEVKWTEEALKELQNVPAFVRGMARRAVEKDVNDDNRDTVNREDVLKTKEKYFSILGTKGEKKPLQIAVLRCETVSEVCPGVACFKAFNRRKLKFSEYGEDVEMIGFFTCGGCSGRRVSRLVESLKKYNLDVIHLSSCMMLDSDYPRCPHLEMIKETIEKKGIKVVEGTHH
ncbi:MAG: CGGC domain-containing protein [Syntrophomonadaceae bacterium]